MDTLRTELENFFKCKDSRETAVKFEHVPYGTAGFRGHSHKIKHLFTRIGLISGLRALVENGDVGIVITASHNPIDDNGAKLIDSNGEMLAADWEPVLEEFCNLPDDPKLVTERFLRLVQEYGLDLSQDQRRPTVLIGYDTRPSCESLVELVLQGLSILSPFIETINYGQVTTPAMHFLVAESNKLNECIKVTKYYEQLIDGFVEIFRMSKSTRKHYKPTELIVDCANGVGYKTMEYLCNNKDFCQQLPIRLINRTDGILNHECGADFVKTEQKAPSNANEVGIRYASLDGDADRVIYFYLETEQGAQKLRMLDGDKIMALYALFLKDSIKRADLEDKLSLGIVQTAYANGASSDYLKQQLGLQVDCVDTGVKNLHRKAKEYDFGIYFEANGHGTIWVSSRAKEEISASNNEAGLHLKQILKILNNYTGDAISDILIVETILDFYDMNIESWYKFYDDRPNSLIKVEVKDRNLIETTNAARTCTKPVGLQDYIDSLIKTSSSQARTFVRASGTENVVRIYAEAKTQKEADEIASKVAEKVIEMCNV